MQEILDAINSGASGEDIAGLAIPESYRAAHVLRSEQEMWAGVPSEDKDPRKSLHIGEVPTPELAPDEVYLAVMASSINFNTVWTSIFEPLPTFGFLDRLGKESVWGARHAQDFHVVGSDVGRGVQVGSAVRNWKPGDRVVRPLQLRRRPGPVRTRRLDAGRQPTHLGLRVELRRPRRSRGRQGQPGHAQACAPHLGGGGGQRAVRLDQLPDARRAPCRSHEAGRHRLHLGATGGIGAYATQLVLNGGGTPIGVVSSEDRGRLLRAMGCEHVIDRKAEGYKFWKDEHTQDEGEWRRLGKKVRGLMGEDPDIVFEHPGRSTMGASVFMRARGGTIVTCAATSGFMIEYDNRHLWMKLKRIVSSHFANYQEAWEMNRLIDQGRIQPVMSAVYRLEEVGEAARAVHRNEAEGKLAVLCLAPEAGQGITDAEKRERIGEDSASVSSSATRRDEI